MSGPPTAAQKDAKDWYVSPGGNIWQATGAEAAFLKFAVGWQGPFTYADALKIQGTVPGPLRAVNKAGTNALKDAGNAVGNPLQGVAAIGDFFQRLTQAATWERVGEVVLGGILVYAGLRAITSGSSTVGAGARKAATSPVKKVTKAAVSVAAPEVRLATRTAAKRAAPKTTARVSAHRANVRKYGAKKPYTPPTPRPSTPRVSHTVRESHIYHHKGPKPK